MNKKPIKPRGKQHDARTASFNRIAKALRVRARNHQGAAKAFAKTGMTYFFGHEQTRADIYSGLAKELDHEAATLRAMR